MPATDITDQCPAEPGQGLRVFLNMNTGATIPYHVELKGSQPFPPQLGTTAYFLLSSPPPLIMTSRLQIAHSPSRSKAAFSCFPAKLRTPHAQASQQCGFYDPRMPHSGFLLRPPCRNLFLFFSLRVSNVDSWGLGWVCYVWVLSSLTWAPATLHCQLILPLVSLRHILHYKCHC